mmetsp:Transcript_29702/g.61070  ORF Transcript_29702/g.61070 Transcript_29702/m.61070 type:complete len:350 (+) Transcript_29702:340-1389(+)
MRRRRTMRLLELYRDALGSNPLSDHAFFLGPQVVVVTIAHIQMIVITFEFSFRLRSHRRRRRLGPIFSSVVVVVVDLVSSAGPSSSTPAASATASAAAATAASPAASSRAAAAAAAALPGVSTADSSSTPTAATTAQQDPPSDRHHCQPDVRPVHGPPTPRNETSGRRRHFQTQGRTEETATGLQNDPPRRRRRPVRVRPRRSHSPGGHVGRASSSLLFFFLRRRHPGRGLDRPPAGPLVRHPRRRGVPPVPRRERTGGGDSPAAGRGGRDRDRDGQPSQIAVRTRPRHDSAGPGVGNDGGASVDGGAAVVGAGEEDRGGQEEPHSRPRSSFEPAVGGTRGRCDRGQGR